MDLEGGVAVVTGGAAGIGRATALALANAGCDVIVADINESGAEHVSSEVEALGRRALAMRVDVAERDQVEDLVRKAISWRGHCDLFVSNAGVGCAGAPEDFTPKEWEYLLGVNLWSCIWPLRLIIPHMRDRGRGHLVFVSSGAGIEGFAHRAPYNVAKFGVVGLAESVARSLKGSGVGVSLVIPGAVATEGWRIYLAAGAEALGPEAVQRLREEQRESSATWPRPETMAEAIVIGIREGRYCILQDNPFQPDWFADTLTRKGRDPDSFVLGG
jgi:NAD(P)-dependent dehydrogenase (short-subunit alcohol dehydrogenase family)